MTSFNHYAYGAIADWMYRRLAGIAPGDAGYRSVVVRPLVTGQLDAVSARFLSPYGPIQVGWELDGDDYELSVTIPPGTTATVWAPGRAEYELMLPGTRLFRGSWREADSTVPSSTTV
jgi:alpha-L-rhamnosidase